MFLHHNFQQGADKSGVLRGDVVGFAGIRRQVVEFDGHLRIFEKVSPNRLPVAL